MRKLAIIAAVTAFCTVASALPMPTLPAGDLDMKYEGFSWETDALGGHPPAGGPGVAGNVLFAVGQILKILDAPGVTTLYDPADFGAEMTFHLHDMVSQGAAPYGPTSWRTEYVGGAFDIYFDAPANYQPDTGPGSYSGVTDGLLWMSASAVSFTTVFNSATQVGFFSGTFQVTGGAAAALFPGGLVTIGAQTSLAVPAGWTYDHRVKGDMRGKAVPEPGSLILLTSALVGVACLRRAR